MALAVAPMQPAGQGPQGGALAHKTMLGLSPNAPVPPANPAPPAAAPQAAPMDPKRTMLGMPQPTSTASPQAGPPAFAPAPFVPPSLGAANPMPAPQQPMPAAGAQPGAPADFKRTMLGMPDAHPPAPAPPASAPLDPKRTMLGMPMSGAAAPQPQMPPPANATMIGVPGPTSQAQPFQAPPQQPQVQPFVPQDASKKTMMGVAVPGIAPTHASAPQGASAPSAHRTMLGVAVPGIAPVNPGVTPAPPAAPAYVPEEPNEPDDAPRRVARKRVVIAQVPLYRRPAVVLSALGVVVAIFAVGVALLWKSPAPIKSEARIDAKGQDYLQITCASCPDGTTLSIDPSTAQVTGGVADVPLTKPLAVGDNKFVVHIDRPGNRRDEDVKLVVPIAYRIRPDLGSIGAQQPTVQIQVEATAGTKVVVDGKPVTLGADGKGMHPVDVSSECSGPNAEQRTIDRKITYEITPKGGATDKGTVSVKVGVPPLVLESPRPQSVIDSPNFLVAGRTLKGAVVEIEGSQIPAGADGTFARKLRVDKMGVTDVRVRSTGKDLAPRTVTFKVKRVTDLAAEAREFAAQAKLDLPTLLADTKGRTGEAITLVGEVVESRPQGYETIVLLDATEGCKRPPCLVRLVRAGNEPMAKGEKTRIFGHVTGLYEAKGAPPVPEIDVDFLIKNGKP